jgi:aminoglycoside/choline kinase family phosphotransferase
MSALRDIRKKKLEQWASFYLGCMVKGTEASSDASFRRYFRFQNGAQNLVAMDAPPESEDCRPVVAVAKMLAKAGVNVPDILQEDIGRGFLLLSDLGMETWLEILSEKNADGMFADAIGVLLKMQKIKRGALLEYDRPLLQRELDLFRDWYLNTHLRLDHDNSLDAALDTVFALLIENALAQGQVFVHRDYMPRNLMDSHPNPGVLDFQDAVWGPISYDPICLFKDAFISWPESKVQGWLKDYWTRAVDAGLPVPPSFEQFQFDCDLMSAHRHLKVIGIFSRICHRDGKPRYLEDVPRFFAYLDTVAKRQPKLAILKSLLADLRARSDEVPR